MPHRGVELYRTLLASLSVAPHSKSITVAPPMPSKRVPVAIVGAGLTGMSTSYHLRSLGIQHRLLERCPEPGGLAKTVEQHGFRFDKTGHLLHLRDPQMRDLALSLLGHGDIAIERCSMVWSHGRFTRYPYQANTFGLPPNVAYECVMGFIQARQKSYPETPANFEQFCHQHFGDGFSKHFMIPYNCRLWGVHPQEITAEWCCRFVPIPTLEDVIAGAVGHASRELGYNAAFYYPREGIGALTKALAQLIGSVECNKEVLSVDADNKRLELADGECVSYDVLVTTMPLDRLVGAMGCVPRSVQQAVSGLRCSSLHYLDVALDVPSGRPFHWVYVPEEKYPFYRVGVYSNFSREMAPDGKACLYIELADRHAPDLASLVPEVASGLVEMGFIERPEQLLFALHRTIDHAYVIYDCAYGESVATVQAFLMERSIISRGRYGGWDYSSMEDALLYGRDAARMVAEMLC